jgi:hypothetical protein
MLISGIIIVVALACGGYLAFSKRLASSTSWKATVTPLASIMGSGFLISAPLLASVTGYYAVFCMAILLIIAYLIGGVMRFNIRHFEPVEKDHGAAQEIALLSRFVLAGSYFISVTYYLQLLAAFALHIIGVADLGAARWVTTGLLVLIGSIGVWRGLDELESVEKYAVSLNLGMIAALLIGLLIYNVELFVGGQWHLPDIDESINLHDLRVLLGLLIVVQGFETSRYLGENHPAEQRISTMRAAQLISTVVYLLFLALTTVLFQEDLGADVTAIIEMCRPVAVVLPLLISVAAIGSQFSAAVADDSGAGGLIEDLSGGQIPARYVYLIIMLVTVAVTWETNVNQIIAYASRAFALYYALQCIVALLVARKMGRSAVGFTALALVCLAVFAFGVPTG